MITLWRIIQAGARNFLRNAWLSTAATAVMTVTLILMTFSYISNSALSSTIKSVTDKIDVSVYLIDAVTPQQLSGLETQLRSELSLSTRTRRRPVRDTDPHRSCAARKARPSPPSPDAQSLRERSSRYQRGTAPLAYDPAPRPEGADCSADVAGVPAESVPSPAAEVPAPLAVQP